METDFPSQQKFISVVLILIVMKDTHGEYHIATYANIKAGLNPYCNERYSWRALKHFLVRKLKVLILIVMKDTHGAGS